MANYLYIRGLKQADYTVFGVADGQKHYYSPLNNRPQPFSSGQQVKRSVLDALVDSLDNERRAPITFNYEITKGRAKGGKDQFSQKEPWNPCDPTYADQLVGGWMRAEKGQGTIKRRSPLSISAMRPLHPSLATLTSEENGTFDRSDRPQDHVVAVRDEHGNNMDSEEVQEWLRENDRTIPLRNWLKLGPRASGLFVYDIAVDLDRIFRISTNPYDPELSPEILEKLREQGWEESGEYILVPQDRQAEILDALAEAVVDWRITSNQSRTFSPQGTLALAISKNANRIVGAIRADLKDTLPDERQSAEPILDKLEGVDLFVSLAARGVVQNAPGSATAMEDAKAAIRTALDEARSSNASV
jgi:hypothetical protein